MSGINIQLKHYVTRRRFLGAAAAISVGAGTVLALDRSKAQEGSGSKRTLRLLCWPGYDDAEMTKEFREKQNVDIEADYIGANDEIFTFLRAGGLGKYDLVSPHNGIVKPLAQAGLVEPIDESLVPTLESLFLRFQRPDWAIEANQLYGAPFLWGTSPMVYSAAHVPSPPAAWIDIQASKFKKKIVMTEDGFGQLLIWNGVLGHEDPTRVTISDLNDTTDFLISMKKNSASGYVGTMNDVARLLAIGTAWVSTIGWESAPQLPAAKGSDLRITHPRPGDYSFCDSWSMAKNAPNRDLALAFIDYAISAPAQAKLIDTLMRGTVNSQTPALLKDSIRALYTYDDLDAVFAVSPLRGFPPLQDNGDGIATYVDWVKSWERVRFTQMS